MPPKRKPADSSSSSPTLAPTPTPAPTTTTTTSNNGKKKAPVVSDSSSESEEDIGMLIDSATKKRINWYWAGDSKKGSQDEWIIYAAAVAEKLEKAYQKYQAATAKEKEGTLRKAKVDDTRYL